MKVDANVARGAQAGAVPCPFCGHPIPVTADDLLGGRPLDCQSCGATLTVDRQRSADALQSLQHLQTQHDASAAKPTNDQRGRPRRSRKRR